MPTTGARYKAIVFDAYGTLVDVNSLLDATRNVITSSDPQVASQLITLWRSKQLEYTWLRSLMKSPTTDSYENFWQVTQDALKFSLKKLGITLTQRKEDDLMNAWLELDTFPDVKESLVKLKQNYQLAVLSNGSPKMLREVFARNELDDLIDPSDQISVDEVRLFKPHPIVYGLVEKKLRVSKSEILFVSGNSWDVIGAQSYGFQTAWIHRNNDVPDRLGASPDMKYADLSQLVSAI